VASVTEPHAKTPIVLLPIFFPRKNSGLGEFRTMENLDATPEIKYNMPTTWALVIPTKRVSVVRDLDPSVTFAVDTVSRTVCSRTRSTIRAVRRLSMACIRLGRREMGAVAIGSATGLCVSSVAGLRSTSMAFRRAVGFSLE